MAALNDLREFACKGIHSLGIRRRISYFHDGTDCVADSGMVDRCMIAGYDLHFLQPRSETAGPVSPTFRPSFEYGVRASCCKQRRIVLSILSSMQNRIAGRLSY
jgi:hypothetical protein